MRIPGLKTLKLAGRWLRSRFVNGAIILGYHSVSETPSDPYSLGITPQHFAEQLEVLRKDGQLLSLQELLRALREGHVPRRAVVLTFDDGYADTLYTAKPLLERYHIPATVFITTGALGREFWWEELKRLLLTPETLPERLSLTIEGTIYEWTVSAAGENRLWQVAADPRLRLLWSLHQELRTLPEDERQRVLARLRIWAGTTSPGQMSRRALSTDEILELAQGDLIEVGAHTVTHSPLADLSPAMQRCEIVQSKRYLEDLLAQPVTSFSYPHGSLSDSTVAVVRETGFTCACRSFNDVTWRGSDRFQLPRLWARDWDGDRFRRWIIRWLKS
jgi:peptidoglycan/xylan/chitin deacetylase (PgdA/CDA1 family)